MIGGTPMYAKLRFLLLQSSRSLLLSMLVATISLSGCASVKKQPDDSSANSPNIGLSGNEPGPYEQLDVSEPTIVAYENYQDPLESFNRAIFKFNHVTYRYFLSPLAKGYRKVTPKPVSKSIGNFFLNLREPLFAVNNLLQAEPVDSGKSLLRFGINSTLGILGLFDPANAWFHMEREKTSFADTLAFYGIGYGAYVVLPFAGPSDFRSGTSIAFDYFLHPLNYLDDESTAIYLKLFDYFQENSGTLESYPKIAKEADDPYIFLRNLYLQRLQRDTDVLRNPDRNTDSAAGVME